ncbi:hypothetical protein ALC57_01814, partial [Trachymyrmex cornetzi]
RSVRLFGETSPSLYVVVWTSVYSLRRETNSGAFSSESSFTRIYVQYFGRFNPDFYQTTNSRRNLLSATTRKNMNTKKKKRNSKKKTTGKSNVTKERRQQRRRSSNRGRSRDRKQSNPVPQPKLPRPPSWSPKRRLLIEEPIPKVKHF